MWAIIFVLVISTASALHSNHQHSEFLKDVDTFMNTGERFTQEEGDALKSSVGALSKRLSKLEAQYGS